MSKFDLAGEQLLSTHFQSRVDEWNVRNAWSSWNGYKLADYFFDVEYEYFCVRNTCATYDICPMQKYFIRGADAEAMLNRMVTRDVKKMRQGRVSYVLWCTDSGRLIDDGTIFRFAENEFMLTCGSPCVAWLKKSALGFRDIVIEDRSDDVAALALQGPTSCAVLKGIGLSGIELAKPYSIHNFEFRGRDLMVSRTGFSGDLGYELWIEPAGALELWDTLYEVGADFGIHPYGEEATNLVRLEAGFIMPGFEFNEALKTVHFEHDQTPLELGLDWMVDFKKPHFNGRTALWEQRQSGLQRKLIKLDIEGNKPAQESVLYRDAKGSKEIGYVTSAMWSPAVKANIALAMVETAHAEGPIWAEIYYRKELRQYSKMARCRVCDGPFWAPPRARATPAGDY